MSDLPKFSFGQPATTSGVFGQPSSGTPTTKSSLFGTNAGPPLSTSTNYFAAGTPIPSAFGLSAFSGANKTTSAGFSFGAAPIIGSMGGGVNTGQATIGSQPSSSNAPATAFATVSTPSKPSEATKPPQTQPTGMFHGANNAEGQASLGNYAVSSTQAETSTPTSKPSTGFFGTSTTPAGPPPTDNAGPVLNSNSMFNLNKPQEQKTSIFGSSTAHSGFGSSTQSGFLQPDSGKSLFNKPIATSQPDLGSFSSLGKLKDNGPDDSPRTTASSDAPNAGAQTTAKPSVFPPSFGTSTAGANAQGSGSSIFASLSQKAPTGASTSGVQSSADPTQSTLTNPTTSKIFGSLEAKNIGSGTSATIIPGTFGSSLFKPIASATSTANDSAVKSATTEQPSSSAPAPKLNTYSGLSQSKSPPATTQPTLAANSTSTSTNAGTAAANLGTSTAGPAPSAQSRLKNKSMDEIITRWASDLSKYQKEFQRQSEKVASWDRMLVENSDKIQKLYGSTLEAERATTEVERQLTAVENDQEELSVWLDHYEKEVNQMISNQVGQGESLQGPDQERERTYKLAEKLSGRLDEMGKDLTEMINEINHASSDLGKSNKADDPLSQVVRILNSHLAQLQQIDQGAAALQVKVVAAQKAGQSIGPSNGLLGPTSDAVDGFYRSFMGRR